MVRELRAHPDSAYAGAMTPPSLRVGFVPGVEPDRFLRRWKSLRNGTWLELIPVPQSRQIQALAAGEVDMCFARETEPGAGSAGGATAGTGADTDRDLHRVPLWEERPVIAVSTDHVLSVLDEITETDLQDETEIPSQGPDDAADRVAVIATGVGYTRLPMSLARLHHRKDVTHRPLAGAEPTRIALLWPREADDELRQAFVGVVRGRTPRSSR